MDRMSPQDASFLWVEDENNPMHVGSVSIFEGPPPSYGDLVRIVVGKLHLVPRYRQKVRFVPYQLGRPLWVDDPHFQVLYHVRQTAVPRPGGDEQLRNLAGRLLAQHLDRTKPLWELWMIEGLEGDRWAIVSKTHHAMVDGVASTDLLTVLFDRSPDAPPPQEMPWAPQREPTDAELLSDAFADAIFSPLLRLQGLPAAARLPQLEPRDLPELWRGFANQWTAPKPTPSSLNGPIGPHRRWSWVRSSLAEVKQIRVALGGTVNDVVLAVITRGFRDLLMKRGEALEGKVVRTLVPVSVRGAEEQGTMTNRVSGLFPDLPIGITDPIDRLEEVRRQMTGLKESRQAVAGDALTQMSGFAPSMWLALSARMGASFPQRLIQTVTTNVPGPQSPLFVSGRPMVDCYPYVPIGGQIRIGIAIFSYVGRLNFGVTGDYDSVPDIDVLCKGLEAGIKELLAIVRRGGNKTKASARSEAGKPATRPGVTP
jgi:diacylglycerol O-acyltransferase / wax synthase